MIYDEVIDSKGRTKRQRNIDFGKDDLNPEINIPDNLRLYWDWFQNISRGVSRIGPEGVVLPILWRDFQPWMELTGQHLSSVDIEIIKAIDDQYCNTLNTEISQLRQAQLEAGK